MRTRYGIENVNFAMKQRRCNNLISLRIYKHVWFGWDPGCTQAKPTKRVFVDKIWPFRTRTIQWIIAWTHFFRIKRSLCIGPPWHIQSLKHPSHNHNVIRNVYSGGFFSVVVVTNLFLYMWWYWKWLRQRCLMCLCVLCPRYGFSCCWFLN